MSLTSNLDSRTSMLKDCDICAPKETVAFFPSDPASLTAVTSVSKRLIRTRFLAAKDNLDIVTYSLFRTKDIGLADELYLHIKEDGGDFLDYAHLSDGPESCTEGIVGPSPLTQAHPEIAIKLKSLPIGFLKPPFWFKKWSVLLRVEQRVGARFSDWESTIEQVLVQELNNNSSSA